MQTPFDYFADEKRAAVRATFKDPYVDEDYVDEKLEQMWRSMDPMRRRPYEDKARIYSDYKPRVNYRQNPFADLRDDLRPTRRTSFDNFADEKRALVRATFRDPYVHEDYVDEKLEQMWRSMDSSQRSRY